MKPSGLIIPMEFAGMGIDGNYFQLAYKQETAKAVSSNLRIWHW